jgi:hypothetical protein
VREVTCQKGTNRGAGRSLGAVVLALVSMVSCGEYFILPGAPGDGVGALEDGGTDGWRGDAGRSDVPDAGGSFDATASDAGDAKGSDTGSSPCLAPPPGTVFCDDFDHASFGALWDGGAPAQSPALGLVSDEFRSAPSSLQAVATSGGGDDQARVLDTRLPIDANADIHVAFELLIDEVGAAYPFGLVFHGPSDLFISFNLDKTSIQEIVWEGGTVNHSRDATHAADGGVPAGQWVVVDLFLHRADKSLELSLGGRRVLTASIQNADLLSNEDCHLHVGLYYAAKDVDWRAHFDNVIVRTE